MLPLWQSFKRVESVQVMIFLLWIAVKASPVKWNFHFMAVQWCDSLV